MSLQIGATAGLSNSAYFVGRFFSMCRDSMRWPGNPSNIASPWFKPAIDQGNLMVALKPATSLQMIAVQDIGKYGLWAFREHDNLNGRAIDIAGDSLTMPETAKALSAVAGRTIGFVPVPIEEVRKVSEDYALMLEWFDRTGYDVDIPATAKESGIKPTRFAEWAPTVKW
jgi:uncharacterized protein YbjT (DUF2867 family)